MRTLTNEISTAPLLHTRQLSISTPPLRIDLALYAGQRVALSADSHSTTAILRTLARLDEPTGGELWWGEREVTRIKPRRLNKYRQKVAYVPANPYTLFNYYSPVESLFSRAERQMASPEKLAAAVDLSPVVVQQQIKDLSGVNLIRVALMRVVLNKPDVLLVDDVFEHVASGGWDMLIGIIQRILGPGQALFLASRHEAVIQHMPMCYSLFEGQLILKE